MMKLFGLLFILGLAGCEKFTTWDTPQGGDFSLRSPAGVVNTKDLRGKNLLIFFGFLHCPHVCPTTIQQINRMAKSFTPRERERNAFLFVTVDPERDTVEHMTQYFAEKDPNFIPLTGSEEEITAALKLFGGGFKKIQGKSEDEVFIDHTSSVFVVNRKGVWVNSLPYDSRPEEFKRALDLAPSQEPYWTDEARAARIKVLGFNEDCDLAQEPCYYTTPGGARFELELSPRPVQHLKPIKLTVRSKNKKLVPKVADLVGLETAMGLIRPKLTKVTDDTWIGGMTLPTCELKAMNWHLRLLLKDQEQENHEIKFKFSSINL